MLWYEVERKDPGVVIHLKGRIGNDGCARLQEALDRTVELNPPHIALDLGEVTFINSTGIGKLLLFYKRMRNRNAEIRIAGIQEDVFTLFKAIRLDKLIPIEK